MRIRVEKQPQTFYDRSCPTYELVGVRACYIEMHGRTYYLDDSTGEAICHLCDGSEGGAPPGHRYDLDLMSDHYGCRLTDCCGAYATYIQDDHGAQLCCKGCLEPVPNGQGDGAEFHDNPQSI